MQTCRVAFISIFVLMGYVGSAGAQTSGGTGACPPFETRAPDQRPAFPGQARACAVQSNVAFDVVVLATGLEQPWIVRRHRRD
jgi:hypothetical protein